jgi:hypothetical protein
VRASGPPRRLRLAAPRRIVVGVTPRADDGDDPVGHCVVAARGRLPRAPDECTLETFPPIVTGVASCALGAVVLAAEPQRGATVDVRLGDGSVRRLRGRGDVVALVVPPRRAVRGLVVRSRAGRVIAREPLRVPPVTRQCGYGFTQYVQALQPER